MVGSMLLLGLTLLLGVPAKGFRIPGPVRVAIARRSVIEEPEELAVLGDEVVNSVVARCPDTKRIIECLVDSVVTVESKTYYVLQPCDEVVAIASFNAAGEPSLIDPG